VTSVVVLKIVVSLAVTATNVAVVSSKV